MSQYGAMFYSKLYYNDPTKSFSDILRHYYCTNMVTT
jgi:peptidoglycan hydrolase-like amidase